MTPGEIKRWLAKAEKWDRVAHEAAGKAELYRQIALQAQARLRAIKHIGTVVSTMQPTSDQVRTKGANISGAKIKAPTLFQRHLQAHHLSLPGWTATQSSYGLKPNTAAGWIKRPGKGGRPIPRVWAERLAAEFQDPALALPESWPNGIR